MVHGNISMTTSVKKMAGRGNPASLFPKISSQAQSPKDPEFRTSIHVIWPEKLYMCIENTERMQENLFCVVRIVPLKIDLPLEMRIGNPYLALARGTSALPFFLCRRCLGNDNLRRSNLQSLCRTSRSSIEGSDEKSYRKQVVSADRHHWAL